MKLKILTLFVIFTVLKKVALAENLDKFFAVSTTQQPSTKNENVNDSLSRMEFTTEIRSALSVFQKNIISELQKTKREYIDEVDAVLEKKLKLYDQEMQNLKTHLIAANQESTFKSERNIQQEINQLLTKTQKEVIFENDQNTKKHLQQIKDDITNLREKFTANVELEVIKEQLIECQANITTEMENFRMYPHDCSEVKKRGKKSSGIYRIQPESAMDDFLVWCDMTTRGGGWTYILNRFDGSQNFNLNWTDYKHGFGKLSGEHWLGLQHLHELTYSKSHELLVELIDFDLKKVYAKYSHFRIGNESKDYIVETLGSYSGDAGDSLDILYRKFTTSDRNNDNYQPKNKIPCADFYECGWWFRWRCTGAMLTGRYIHNPTSSDNYYQKSSIKWFLFHGLNSTLKEARIMIRPVNL